MAYETKVLLLSLYKLAERAENLEDVKQIIKDLANAEGVVIPNNTNEKEKQSGGV